MKNARFPLGSALAAVIVTGLAGAALSTAHADTLVTTDGRIIEVKKARKIDEGYRLVFEHGEVVCPEEYVASVEIEGDMSDYVPQNDDEREKLEKGYVRYKGRWWSQVAYENELKKIAKETRELTEDLAAHSRWENAYEKETKHFIVRTDTSKELLEYYADLMETWYSILDKRIGIKPPPQLRRTKMHVNIFKSREEFHDVTGTGGGVAGFFSFLDESLNFYHDFQEPSVSDWIALHEGTHLLTYLIEPQGWPQIWINEGIADYLGSATITRDKKGRLEIEPGRIQTDRILTVQQAMKDGTFVTLEKLFSVEKSDFTAFEYAHAWSFVYFLNNSKKQYQKGFDKFFEDVYTLPKSVEYVWTGFPNKEGTAKIAPPEEVRRVLLKYLKVDDVQALQDEWKEFISGIAIDTPEALFKRGYRAVNFGDGDDDQAMEDLNGAIAGGVTDPRAYWARGRLRRWKGDRSGAIEDYKQAVEMSPLQASFRFDLGRALTGYGGFFSPWGGTVTVRTSGGVSDWELDPDDPDVQEGHIQIGLACEMDPRNSGYANYLDEFLEAMERYEKDE